MLDSAEEFTNLLIIYRPLQNRNRSIFTYNCISYDMGHSTLSLPFNPKCEIDVSRVLTDII